MSPMLSPGKHHEAVPRTLIENLAFREAILEAAEDNPAVQAELRRMCEEDILFFINVFVWQSNPSKALEGIAALHPFITFPAQEVLITARPETHPEHYPFDRGILWCIENKKTAALEKSRWQGASWIDLIVEVWLGKTHNNVQILNISRNEEAVDDGTPDSLFWKLRYIVERLPVWLVGEVEDSKLYMEFKRTNSTITGTATTKKAGVGGRATWIVADEYPEIEQGQAIREKTALTADSRLFVGTHLGVGTPFQIMCDPHKSPEIVRMRLHWTDNPEQYAGAYEYDPKNPTKPKLLDPGYEYPKDFQFILDGKPVGGPRPGVRSPWYDRKCAEMGDERAVAMNLDIDAQGAARQFFDALKIRNYITAVCREPSWVGDVDYDPAGRFRGLMEDAKGRLRMWVRPVTDGHTLPKSKYFIGADIAAGTGATPSCFSVMDGRTQAKVMEYSNPFIEEREYAQLVVAVAGWLVDEDGNGAMLVWDSSGQQGIRFETEVLKLGYANIYHDGDDLAHLHVNRGPQKKRPGWYSSNPQKYNLFKDYREALYEHELIDRSEACLLETLLFEYDAKTGVVQHSGETRKNDPTGAKKNHGDLCTSAALMYMIGKEMAEGGRQAENQPVGPPPNSLEWLLALESHREASLMETYG